MVATPDAKPNSWTVEADFSKFVVTLGGALLGLTVTLAAQLIGKTDSWTLAALVATWFTSGISIFAGVFSHAYIVRYLRRGEQNSTGQNSPDEKSANFRAGLLANTAYISLLLAAIAFGIFGWFAVSRKPTVTATAIVDTTTQAMPGLSGDRTSTWRLKSLVFDSSSNGYDVVMVRDGSTETFTLTLNSSGEITKARQP